MSKQLLGLPDALVSMLAQADQQRGFPAGTMAAVMQQESGGNSKYLNAPDTYHYGLNAEGKRIAGHTGKVSTAFGPFGILESTGRDPGYGVKPLQNKSLEEQVRFASEYLDARSKSAGSLQAGLAGYGEGEKYSRQVARRIQGNAPVESVPMAAPVQQAMQVPVEAPPVVVAQNQPAALPVMPPPEVLAQAVAPVPVEVAPDPWAAIKRVAPQRITPADMNYGGMPTPLQVAQVTSGPNFSSFLKPLRKAV
jgi:hypothetical protein